MAIPTPQAIKLYTALKTAKIKSTLESYDGHKHVDISIEWANLDIEIDGNHHYLDPEQIAKDLDRTYYSQENDEIDTFHVPNFIVDNHLEQLVKAIAKVARERYNAIKEGDL